MVRRLFYREVGSVKDSQKKLLKETLVCGGILGAYYVFIRLTGLSIPCFFQEITGMKCPGCGLTSMCMHFAKAEYSAAFHANPLMFFLGPLLAIVLVLKIAFDPKWLGSSCKPYKAATWAVLGITVVFWVTRNLLDF